MHEEHDRRGLRATFFTFPSTVCYWKKICNLRTVIAFATQIKEQTVKVLTTLVFIPLNYFLFMTST